MRRPVFSPLRRTVVGPLRRTSLTALRCTVRNRKVALVEHNESPVPDLSRATRLFYSAGSIGTGAFYSFNNFVLPPILKSFGAPDLLIGLLSSTRSIEGAVIQPTIGAMSDRVWTRFGRRTPFMLI